MSTATLTPSQEPTMAIAGAIYDGTVGLLQPGCLVCAATIPEKQAKFRSKVCSDACRKALRKLRETRGALETTPTWCQVCRGKIPPASAKKLSITCGSACRNELRRYRWQILKRQKCPHCYHPSSPAEWESYRQWRASQGSMQAFMKLPGLGNLTAKRESQLRKALGEVTALLRLELKVILDSYCSEKMEGQPVRSSLTAEGAVLALPLEKAIANAEELLASRKG